MTRLLAAASAVTPDVDRVALRRQHDDGDPLRARAALEAHVRVGAHARLDVLGPAPVGDDHVHRLVRRGRSGGEGGLATTGGGIRRVRRVLGVLARVGCGVGAAGARRAVVLRAPGRDEQPDHAVLARLQDDLLLLEDRADLEVVTVAAVPGPDLEGDLALAPPGVVQQEGHHPHLAGPGPHDHVSRGHAAVTDVATPAPVVATAAVLVVLVVVVALEIAPGAVVVTVAVRRGEVVAVLAAATGSPTAATLLAVTMVVSVLVMVVTVRAVVVVAVATRRAATEGCAGSTQH